MILLFKTKSLPENIKMNKLKVILITVCLSFLSNLIHAQDTIRLTRKPNAILKSWHPEFKEFPTLKVGSSKIIFVIIPELKNTSIRDNDINLTTSNTKIEIKETEKPNQYLITVNPTNEEHVEFELWFDLGDNTILLNDSSNWKNIKDVYPRKENRILIDIIKLKLIE